MGLYNYTIVVYDQSDNEASHTVYVIVGSSTPGFEFFISLISLLVIGVYIFRRRRNIE